MKSAVRGMIVLIALWLATPAMAQFQYRVLVLAMASKYHYEYVPIARESLERLARLHDFELRWTDTLDKIEGDISRYAAIVLLNTPTEDLTPAQRKRFEAYVRGGGNTLIVHRAAIAPKEGWPWYERLVGRAVGVHPMLQTGMVTVADPRSPAAAGLPARWLWSDEFYVTTNPHGIAITPVLDVDESSYDPTRIWPGQVARPMGNPHPVAWYRRVGAARVFVTTLGHQGEAYRDPLYLAHLMGGLYWTATGLGEGR